MTRDKKTLGAILSAAVLGALCAAPSARADEGPAADGPLLAMGRNNKDNADRDRERDGTAYPGDTREDGAPGTGAGSGNDGNGTGGSGSGGTGSGTGSGGTGTGSPGAGTDGSGNGGSGGTRGNTGSGGGR